MSPVLAGVKSREAAGDDMTFLVSLIFVFLFYVLPLRRVFVDRLLVFPVLGPNGSWLMTAAIIFIGLALIALAVKQFEEMLTPALPGWRRELNRRTGVYRLDNFGFRLAILATALFVATDTSLVPLGVASAVGFASLKGMEVEPRAVRQAANSDAGTAPEKEPTAEPEEPVGRKFSWRMLEALEQPYDGTIELTIDRRRYVESADANPYRRSRPAVRSYRRLVVEGITDEVVNLARDLKAVSVEQGFSSYQEIACVLAFVQAIPYAEDAETKGHEYIRWPIETLYDGVGDSDCKSVLLAALLKTLEFDIMIVEAEGRTGVGVAGADGLPGRFLTYKGKKYYYCETSTTGWKVGRLPPDIAEGRFRVYPV